MKKYNDSLTLRAALKKYFKDTGFSEKSYTDRWFLVELGPIPFVLPNVKSRQKAIRFHDLHHVLTEYETSLIGESEIGAWELASGCQKYPAAVFYNSLAMLTGLLLDRKRVLKALARGRRSQNLYHRILDSKLMSGKLGDLRHELNLQEK